MKTNSLIKTNIAWEVTGMKTNSLIKKNITNKMEKFSNRKTGENRICRFTQTLTLLLCLLILITSLPEKAAADTGPKPSVQIEFENMGNELCYVTLLSKEKNVGPHCAWTGSADDALNNKNTALTDDGSEPDWLLDYNIWKAFAEYKDSDGFYFLQFAEQLPQTRKFNWSYYPPDVFKILLYYPEKNVFVASDILERYAFDSYFTVDMSGVNLDMAADSDASATGNRIIAIEAAASYNYKKEITALAVRIIITVIVELIIALFFGYRERFQLLLILGANLMTQIVLNVLLNYALYLHGPNIGLRFEYALLEILVFMIEAVIYYILLNRHAKKQKPKSRGVVYAFAANLASFLIGICLMDIIPYFF